MLPTRELSQFIERFTRLPCARVSLGYGGVLTVHLGALISYDHPSLIDEKHGTWRIFTNSCSWRILQGTASLAGDNDDEAVIAPALNRFLNVEFLGIDSSAQLADARLQFGNSLSIEFFQASCETVAWEILGPGLSAGIGPGPFWSPDVSNASLSKAEEAVSNHSQACAERWHRIVPGGHPRGGCRNCAYYCPLRGTFYFWDFGLCSNKASACDGRVVNVKSGCDQFADSLSA